MDVLEAHYLTEFALNSCTVSWNAPVLPWNKQRTLSKQTSYRAAWWSREHIYISVCICQTSGDPTASSGISLKTPVPTTFTSSNTDDLIQNSTLILYTQPHNIEHLPAQHTIFIKSWIMILTICSVFTNLQGRLFNSLKDLYFWIV